MALGHSCFVWSCLDRCSGRKTLLQKLHILFLHGSGKLNIAEHIYLPMQFGNRRSQYATIDQTTPTSSSSDCFRCLWRGALSSSESSSSDRRSESWTRLFHACLRSCFRKYRKGLTWFDRHLGLWLFRESLVLTSSSSDLSSSSSWCRRPWWCFLCPWWWCPWSECKHCTTSVLSLEGRVFSVNCLLYDSHSLNPIHVAACSSPPRHLSRDSCMVFRHFKVNCNNSKYLLRWCLRLSLSFGTVDATCLCIAYHI